MANLTQNIGIRFDIQEADFYNLIYVSLVVWHFDFQVVTCKSRHHYATHRTLEQHLRRSAEILFAEVVMTTAAQLLQTLDTCH